RQRQCRNLIGLAQPEPYGDRSCQWPEDRSCPSDAESPANSTRPYAQRVSNPGSAVYRVLSAVNEGAGDDEQDGKGAGSAPTARNERQDCRGSQEQHHDEAPPKPLDKDAGQQAAADASDVVARAD